MNIMLSCLTTGLIVLGSDLAFESIISGGGVTLQIAYMTPIIVVCGACFLLSFSLLNLESSRFSSVDARSSHPGRTLTSVDGATSST